MFLGHPNSLAGEGLLAEWHFREGQGEVARDRGSHGHDAQLHGPAWLKQGDGFALEFDGVDDYVDCGTIQPAGVAGPVTIEAWVKPTRKAQGEAPLLGEGMKSFLLTYYNTELLCWYIGHGDTSNTMTTQLKLDQWQHIAATFDGKRMVLFINGRPAASRESTIKNYQTAGRFQMGTTGPADIPRFKGLLGHVRIHARALSEDEVRTRFKSEAVQYGLATGASAAAASEAGRFFHEHPNAIDLKQQGGSILFANRLVGLELQQSATGFQLGRLHGIADNQDFLVSDDLIGFRDLFEIRMIRDPRGSGRDQRGQMKASLFGIMDEMAEGAFSIGSHAARTVSWRLEDVEGATKLLLEWKGIDVREERGALDVLVTVTLRDGDPLSYWRIALTNRCTLYGIERVRFPLLNLAPIGKAEENVLVYPWERGGMVKNPFAAPTGFGRNYHTAGAFYPHDFNMQFNALYDGSTGKGIFFGTRDSKPNLMNIQIVNTPADIAWRPGHFPPNITFAEEHFALSYDCVAGPFHGDWFDAAQIYREWALKQSWASRGPRATRKDSPRWYNEAPLIFYTVLADSATGSHSLEENVKIAGDHFREFVKWAGMPLPAIWYSWKDYTPGLTTYDVPFGSHRIHTQGRWAGLPCMNVHDGNYPKIGALPAFAPEVKRLRKQGGMVSPYVALEVFDQGPDENSPYAHDARPFMVRDLYGVIRTWSTETAWQACVATPWWQQRLKDTCEQMLKREGVAGFYLDVMQGSGLPCYWTPHGHSAAGGDSMTTGMHDLVRGIHETVKARDPGTFITGENCSENMMDVIDGTLIYTMDRYNTAPVFAVVYQDYLKRYGTELSMGSPDDFILESASLFVEGATIGRIRLRPRSAIVSFQDPKQKELLDFLEQVVGYYRNKTTMKFLAYGQVLRPLTFAEPSPMPMLTYKGDAKFPALMSGVFRSGDGELGVFVVNAGRAEVTFHTDFDPARYGVAADALMNAEAISADGVVRSIAVKTRGPVALKATLPSHGATMFRLNPITSSK
jgi:hypothetical protein